MEPRDRVVGMNYPVASCYFGIGWRGEPFIAPNGALDAAAVANAARWDVLTLEANQCLARPDILAALREANPAIHLIAFMNLSQRFVNLDHVLDPDDDLEREIMGALAALGDQGFVWSALHGDWFNPELPRATAMPGHWSHFNGALHSVAAVEATTEIIVRRVVRSGLFSGLQFDWAGHSIIGLQRSDTDVIDLRRAGFADSATFDLAYRAGHRLTMKRISDAAPAGFTLTINDGLDCYPFEPGVTGSMSENWPNQGAGSWIANMQRIWALEQRKDFGSTWLIGLPARYEVSPAGVWPSWARWDIDGNEEAARFLIASACMTRSGLWSMTTNERPPLDDRYLRWFPEQAPKGWLGEPLGPARMVAGKTWLREFTGGCVIVDPARRRGSFYERRA